MISILRSFDDDVANVFNTNDQWILEQKTDDTNATVYQYKGMNI